jgi:hypothetical protein
MAMRTSCRATSATSAVPMITPFAFASQASSAIDQKK